MAKVFLSYRREDSRHATERIYDEISRCFGKKNVFKDIDSIPLGTDFRVVIQKAITSADVLLAVIGNKWARARGLKRLSNPDDFVRIEIETALARGIPVIPLLVNDAKMPEPKELPPAVEPLAFLHGVPIRSDPDFWSDMQRVTAAIESLAAEAVEPLHVLLIDEDALNRRLSSAAVNSQGHRSVDCSPSESLAAIKQHDFDLVFMQARMGSTDAFELLASLRKNATKCPLVVGMTNSSERHSQCLRKGMDAVLSRPVKVPELTKLIARFLGDVDREKFLGVCGGDPTLASESARIFLDDSPQMIQRLRAAIEARNIDELSTTGHDLRGAFATVGAERARELANELYRWRDIQHLSDALKRAKQLEESIKRIRFSLHYMIREFEQR